LEAANRGLEIDPEHQLCTNMRAQALVKLGDREGAAATMGEALARRPDDAFTHSNQGWAMLHAGQPYKALEHFREALRLDPELEWARAGIVEAMKARNFIYRWMLAWFLWMSRLQPGVRWGLVIGAFFGMRFVGRIARNSPELAPYLWPLLYAYFGFVLITWLAPSFFNLLLRLDRFGRYALSTDQVRGANVLAACLVATGVCLLAAIGMGSPILFYCTLMFALLALPASAIFSCDEGWPRWAAAGMTVVLLAAVLSVLAIGHLPRNAPPVLFMIGVGLMSVLPWGMLLSQFAASYLVGVRAKK
jgi:tetratricopeptide (TPR) repeat protein